MEDAIVKYLILDMRPLNSVEQAGFIYLLNYIQPDYAIPGRTTITSRVSDQCKTVRQSVELATNNAKYVCAQADIWSSRRIMVILVLVCLLFWMAKWKHE